MQQNWLQFVLQAMGLDAEDMRRVWRTNKPPLDVPQEWTDLLNKLDKLVETPKDVRESETC